MRQLCWRDFFAHDPDPVIRRACGYPEPIVEHHAAIAEYRAALGA